MIRRHIRLSISDLFYKGVPAEFMLVNASGNLSFDNILVAMPAWSIPGTHSTLQPQHPFPAHQYVLYGSIKGMPHMKGSGNIRGRYYDRKGLGIRTWISGKIIPA
jgi:hypothetical protein